jgi:MFS family permease
MTTLTPAELAKTKAWQLAILVYFCSFGAPMASFMVRMPLIKDLLHVNTATLGLLILISSVGAIVSLSQAGRIISRVGTKPAMMGGLILAVLAWIAQAYFASVGSVFGYTAFGFIAGLGFGLTDVSINVDGSAIEQRLGKNLMPRLHAGYSIGTVAGAGLGTLAATYNFSIFWQIVILAGLQLLVPVFTYKYLVSGNGIEAQKSQPHSGDAGKVKWLNRTAIWLGIGILGITIAEGASNDWLALGVVEGYHSSATNAGISYAVLLSAMTLTRFFGGNLADKIGKARALQSLAVVGIIGLILVIVGAPNVILAWVGSAMWGVGVALGFPLFLSAAGEGEHAAKRVSFVALWGYGAFIVGPPLLGFVGQVWGILSIFGAITGFLVITAVFASAAGNKTVSVSAQAVQE